MSMIAIGVRHFLFFYLLLLVATVTTSGFSMQPPPSPGSDQPATKTSIISGEGFATTPEAVIFDIDGTLADSWKLGFEATLVVLKNHGIPLIDEATYHECTKFSTPQRLARHAGLEPIVDKTTAAQTAAEVEEHNARYERVGRELATEFDDLYVGLVSTKTAGFFPGIRDVLEKLAAASSSEKTKVGCLTNACVAYAHAVLETNDDDKLGLREMCRSVHGADTVPSPKPDPDGLYGVCTELGVDPSRAVYVGDSPSDALAAHAAGMPSIGVAWGSHGEDSLKEAPFDLYASTPDELCRMLELV